MGEHIEINDMNENIEATDKIGTLTNSRFIQLSDCKKLLVRKVLYKNEEWIDIRNWVRFRGRVDFFPTKKGIFVEKRLMESKLLPLLEKIMNAPLFGDGET